jgi:hypothetical protein
MKTTWLVGVIVIMTVVSALGLWGGLRGIPGLAERHRLEGVFAPTYDEAGEALYFLHRETRGTSVGPGWEHFTPPARARASHDVFSLRRLDLASGRVEVLESWPRSPLVERRISTYRGRIFTVTMARIRVMGDTVEYRVRMSVPRQPTSELYRLAGLWRPGGGERAEWEKGHAELSGYDRTPLNGRWEAMAAPGPQSYPSAIVAFDASTEEVRVLVETPAYRDQHPDGVPVAWLHERARRPDIERIDHLGTTYRELLERFRAEGLTEIEAGLAATREMQRLGLYPKPRTLVARALSPGETLLDSWPNFIVPDGEMRSGVFRDIERALATPGTEVERSMGSYIIHRDYENSAKLNAYLDGGGRTFYVTYREATYEVTVQPRRVSAETTTRGS